MTLFKCCCDWSFVIGKKKVFGPIYPVGLPGHFTGPSGCMHVGRMMPRAEFDDAYADCAACHAGAHRHTGRDDD
jgi:hypothetical protein